MPLELRFSRLSLALRPIRRNNGSIVPTISMFYGIIIRMYAGSREHNPPHFHAYYGDFRAIFSIEPGELTEGNFPVKQRKLVEAWAVLHRDDLMADWLLASGGETPFSIDPLK
jgi:hypothetical protein